MLVNKYDGQTHDYSSKGGVVYTEIVLPDQAPSEFYNRSTLWNRVEEAEKRVDARTAREIEIALPASLNRPEQIDMTKDYVKRNFVSRGMCADIAFHDNGNGNPHAHIMLTTRTVDREGFGKKDRSWDKKQNVEQWRKDWADTCNRTFEKHSMSFRIDHRSYERQRLPVTATVHMGAAAQMEKRGIPTLRGYVNREIRKYNHTTIRELRSIAERRKAQTIAQQAAVTPPPAPQPVQRKPEPASQAAAPQPSVPITPEPIHQPKADQRNRLPGESLVQYMARLRALSEKRRLENPHPDRKEKHRDHGHER